MPYNVGEKGSHGCSGYPAVKTKTGEVMGCHETKAEAVAQIQAIAISESKKLWAGSAFGKDMGGAMPDGDTTPAGMKNPDQCTPGSASCGDETCKVCAKKSVDPDAEYNNSVDFGNAKVSTSSYTVTYKKE